MLTTMATPETTPIEIPTACPLVKVDFEVAVSEGLAAGVVVAADAGVLAALADVELAACQLVKVLDAV